MSHRHLRPHHQHRDAGPALWLATVLVLLFIGSLTAIVLFLHRVLQVALEVAGYAFEL